MIKKFLALTAGAVFSLNASAAFVQYGLHGALDGIIIQDDTDQSIALFAFQISDNSNGFGMEFLPRMDDGRVMLYAATTYFRNNGPTNFSISNSYGSDQFTDLKVTFGRTTRGNFEYTAIYNANLYANMPPTIKQGTVSGLATLEAVDPRWNAFLYEGQSDGLYVPHIVPTYIKPREVPEPGSLALFAIGALGAVGLAMRRKAQG